ncbi:MAG: hypothetical protein KMY55_08110, partial [Dethiosulfatibacter sp.]|nr:hypothetical protein [Dethiosulfatibacter sp.]
SRSNKSCNYNQFNHKSPFYLHFLVLIISNAILHVQSSNGCTIQSIKKLTVKISVPILSAYY